ncbi:uncharacterized protein A1O9_04655 [Exophiala aquamarina CBS 119918]|uniref:Transcription factor domain-containing protein n=1 Tax=Exophiala aquamarina CBS 119918 TaxID=1182545 RepID=A0A072PJB4_9EURO|nr:uncharacterized protein A1O9_04655 [Exophiala aquamarina CBS 119918]KEF59807.1 hypothetical protein A1O9_04655 [Exophiala aquamarina CBS 119918]
MQRVRQEELAQGKKRPTGRDLPKRPSRIAIRSRSTDSDSSGVSDPSSARSESIALNTPVPSSSAAFDGGATTFSPPRHPSQRLQLFIAPAVHELDPFDTLPTHGVPHKSVEGLLQYCFDTLLPMTFSIETASYSERMARQGLVLRQKATSPAVFLGFMATVAAHRAILRGNHQDLAPSETNHDDLITDPDYKRVKHHTIVAVRKMIENRTARVGQYLIDACFGLVSVATIVGNFREARVHLQGISQMMSIAEISQESVEWLPITDVKLATALLSKPSLPLPWERQPIPQEILQLVSPPSDSDQSRLGTSLTHFAGLSSHLKELISRHRDICDICEFNVQNQGSLSHLQNRTLNRKATELEYDLTAYPYETSLFERDHNNQPIIPALENMVRLASLGLLAIAPHAILPSTGSGRATTHHQKRAFEDWLRERRNNCGRPELQVILWSLFCFIQCAEHQPEADFFIQQLALLTRELWLIKWHNTEATMYGFLYIPGLQAKKWENIYHSAMSVR